MDRFMIFILSMNGLQWHLYVLISVDNSFLHELTAYDNLSNVCSDSFYYACAKGFIR